jgi:hypothetical protein
LVKRVDQKLRQPDIKQALRDAFEEAAGFTPAEALSLHVQHIRGFKRPALVVDADGTQSIEIVTEKPNYAALKDYVNSVIGTAEKRISVHQKSINVHLDGGSATGETLQREGPPPTAARMLNVTQSSSDDDHGLISGDEVE